MMNKEMLYVVVSIMAGVRKQLVATLSEEITFTTVNRAVSSEEWAVYSLLSKTTTFTTLII